MMKQKTALSMALLAAMAGGLLYQGLHAVTRKPTFPVESIIVDRWSPRGMSGEKLTHQELMSLFEAARWAPSSYNSQPWRFVYAERDSKAWDTFMNLLVEFNQGWCKDAGALILIVSKDTFDHDGSFSRTHSFHTGAAWENLALQGNAMGLVVHAMSGFDYDRAKKELNVPDGYSVEAMVAVGKPANGTLKAMRSVEEVSERKPLEDIVMKETFSS